MAHFITTHALLAFSYLTTLFSLRPPTFSPVFGALPPPPPFLKLALLAWRFHIPPRATFSLTSLHVPGQWSFPSYLQTGRIVILRALAIREGWWEEVAASER
jgi:hypothetical protein